MSLRVSQLAAEWIAGASERSGWTPKTKDCIEAGLGLVTELLGDPPIGEVDYAAAAKAVAALRRTPKNRTQRGLRGVPVAELCARVERGELEPLSDVTVRNILGRCSPFWSWAVRRDHCAKHWFEGAYKARKTVRDEDARQPFTPDELRAAFRTFRTVDDDFRWFPVCLLYSGLRTGELAQLTPQDVREVDGVPCLDVNVRGGKSVKTPGAVRLVPVHPVLIRLGLLQHARQMKEEGEQRLFRLPMGREPSTAASKRWQNLRRRLGVKASLHAARHSFSTQLHKAGVSLDDIASLVGHVRGAGLETARYAKRPSPAALLKIIERLRYPVGEPE